MEDRGSAASTIDRRHSTVCGFYRFAHIDVRIASNPAQYVRRPQVHPSTGRGLDRSELGVFLFTAEQYDRAHAALAVLLGLNGLRVSEACATNIEDLPIERGHRMLRARRRSTTDAARTPIATRPTSSTPSSRAADAARAYDGRRERRRQSSARVSARHCALAERSDRRAARRGAPVLASVDTLLIEELSEDEDEAFAAALDS